MHRAKVNSVQELVDWEKEVLPECDENYAAPSDSDDETAGK